MASKTWLGMPAIALAFAVMAIGCGGEDRALNGYWLDGAGGEFRFRNGNWESWYLGAPEVRGTYTARDGEIRITVTHAHEDGAWLDRDGIRDLFIYTGMDETLGDAGLFAGMMDAILAVIDGMLDELFAPQEGTYSVSGDILTLTIDGEMETLTRR